VAEAAQAWRDPLQAALACVTSALLLGRAPFAYGQEAALELSEDSVPLGRNRVLALRLGLRYRIVAPAPDRPSVQLLGYSYWLLDHAGNELVLYQWVPDGPSPVTTPHLHVGALRHPILSQAARRQFAPVVTAHLPTGHVPLAALLRVAIADLGVVPLEADPDRLRMRLNAAERIERTASAWQIEQPDR
jgi:hypothetical protein